jgi:hypothetical protein
MRLRLDRCGLNKGPRMAKRFAFLFIALTALYGCQSSQVQTLPAVTFDGPQVAPATMPSIAAAPAPVLPKATTQPVAPVVAMVRSAAQTDVNAEWVPAAEPRPWQWIIIHHSATQYGNAHIIDGWHRDKGWDELGYHFVIDNGNAGGDGQIEVGPRWPKQKWGAHTKTADNRFNDFGIGICLVGNFDVDHPTDAQMKSVAKLVAYLMKTYRISADHIIGHGDAKPTDCPGRNMSVADVRRAATALLVASGDIVETKKVASSDELMK